jgi:hypothetical protein
VAKAAARLSSHGQGALDCGDKSSFIFMSCLTVHVATASVGKCFTPGACPPDLRDRLVD